MKKISLEETIKIIEAFFRVPDHVADEIKIVAEKVRGGYVLFETRPRCDGSPGPWTKLPVAKIIFYKPTQSWKLYWQRASGKWEYYGQCKTLNNVLKAIETDTYACFWG